MKRQPIMRRLLFSAAVAAVLGSCSESGELSQDRLPQQATGDGTVSFGVYTNRALSRAGQRGSNDVATLREGDGIGVFGYHTNNQRYDAKTSLPNFMYNQQVTYDADTREWTYEPVKYWPNELGENAVSDDVDYLTFFAYAPFVEFDPVNGVAAVDVENDFDAEAFAKYLGYSDVVVDDGAGNVSVLASAVDAFMKDKQLESATEAREALKAAYVSQMQLKNITGATRNGDKGDPIIHYAVDTNPQTSVDLLWGVAADNSFKGLADGQQPISAGAPFVNISKQAGTNDKIQWRFYHALSKLNVQMTAAADVATQGDVAYTPTTASESMADVTKIYLRSIDFTGFVMKGALNLHSRPEVADYRVKPVWMNDDGTDLTVRNITFYDGLKDGKEGYTDSYAFNEKLTGLNPVLIEEPTVGGNWEKKRPGIPTDEYANLFAGARTAADPIFVIPTGERMAITIVYDVMTKDDHLNKYLSDGNTKGSLVQNKITQVLSDTKIEAGKAYTIKIVVGMESVKVDVKEVEGWDVQDETDVDMPYNPGLAPTPTDDDDTVNDLSLLDCAGNARTDGAWSANTYMVHEAGQYKLPLVYGNALKGGQPNTAAYTGVSGQLEAFVRHDGQPIVAPWIKDNGITVSSAEVLWQDADGLVTAAAIDGDYLTLTVAKDATAQEGNALVAAKDASGNVVWSWHIWVTKQTFADLTEVSTGDHTYKVTPVNLGWVGANANKGTSTYYQWGRKDPFPATGAVLYEESSTATIADNIKEPTKFYYNSANHNSSNTTWNNMWDAGQTSTGNIKTATVKTVYDPSPAGFCVPTGNLFYFMGGANTGRQMTSWDDAHPGASWDNDVVPGSITGEPLFYPASGLLNYSNGQPNYVGSSGYYWSASAYNGDLGRRINFSSVKWSWSNSFRAYGFPVRAVAEE